MVPKFVPLQANQQESQHLKEMALSLFQQAMGAPEEFENINNFMKIQMSLAVLSAAAAHLIILNYKDWNVGKEQVLSNLEHQFKECRDLNDIAIAETGRNDIKKYGTMPLKEMEKRLGIDEEV